MFDVNGKLSLADKIMKSNFKGNDEESTECCARSIYKGQSYCEV